MAGRGPAPKPAGQRRRRNAPARGEWIELYPLDEPVVPEAAEHWTPEARRRWEVWRSDPVTSLWGPADTFAARELAEHFDVFNPSEQRLRMDGLGLTPKGKRDLRWRVVDDEAAADGEVVGYAVPLHMPDPRAA